MVGSLERRTVLTKTIGNVMCSVTKTIKHEDADPTISIEFSPAWMTLADYRRMARAILDMLAILGAPDGDS